MRPTEPHLLHFDLAGAAAAPYTFHVAQRQYPLARHSRGTLADARAENSVLRLLGEEAVNHYAEVPMPSDAVALTWVTQPVQVDGLETERIVSMGIHVPREARLRDVRGNLHLQGDGTLHPKLAWRRLPAALLQGPLLKALDAAPDLLADVLDPYETAVALLFKHPELINLSPDASSGGPVTVIEACIRRALSQYPLLIEIIANHRNDWSSLVRALDTDGKPLLDDEGKPVFNGVLHRDVMAAVPNPLSRALVLSKQTEALRGQAWSLQYGGTDAAYSGQVSPKRQVTKTALRGAGDVNWRLKNLTPTHGLEFEPAVRFNPAQPGSNWRADDVWSAEDTVEPFNEVAQKALADGKLCLVFGAIQGTLTPVAGRERVYAVSLSGAGSSAKAKGECRLSSAGTALQYLVSSSDGPFGNAYFAISDGAAPRKLRSVAVRDGGNSGDLMVVAKNHWLRHLSVYVEFFDVAGKIITPPNWTSRFPGGIEIGFDGHPTKRYVDMVSPVGTMMGIPLPTESSHLQVPLPANAAMARFSWGGLGHGPPDPVACPAGAIMTVVMEMALPVVMLAAGAAVTASGGLMTIVRQRPVLAGLLLAFGNIFVGTRDDPAKTALTIGVKLIPAIAKAGLGKLSQEIAKRIVEGGAKKAIPFLNIAFFIADVLATAAQLAQTNLAIRQSPRAHITEVTRSIDLRITITSSTLYKKFPDHHHHLAVVVSYDSGATLPKLVKPLPPTTLSDDIVVEFKDVPAAGQLRVLVFFYAENDWQSGQGASAWLKAEGSGGSSTLVVSPIEIEVNPVPLGRWSVYQHLQKIVLSGGRRSWQAAPAPTATKSTPSSLHGVIEKRHSITMSQYNQMIAYGWSATDLDLPADDPGKPASAESLYTLQNLSVLADPQQRWSTPPVGFTAEGGVAYDMLAPDDGSGRNFFIDPTRGVYDEDKNPAGGHHLRWVSLNFRGTPVFNARRDASRGRFPASMDAMVVHPDGCVFAIRRGAHKLYRLNLAAFDSTDADAPMATPSLGEGDRHGLIKTPLALALALDGRVLVLEGGNRRVQCFDSNSNPVDYFLDPGTRQRTPVMPLRTDLTTLLDMAVEAKGHIFVLGHTGTGKKPEDYRLDLYDPAGGFLSSTGNFTAARITVDLLRNVFALNFEVLSSNGRRPEPGISQWRAPAPPRGEPASASSEEPSA